MIRLPGLDVDSDFERLAEGLTRARQMVQDPAMRRLCELAPTPGRGTPAEKREWIRASCNSIPHTVGTCAKGAPSESLAVVDSSGRVHGIEGLSVIDASIIPLLPAGFPHLVTVMLEERLAPETNSRS